MINVIPRPKKVRDTGGEIRAKGLILVGMSDLAPVFEESYREFLGGNPTGNNSLKVHVCVDRKGPSGSYRLRVGDRDVRISGADRTGAIYGLHTLFSLCRRVGKSVAVRKVSIDDRPDFTMRGLSDDLSRRQVSTLDDFKRILRELSRLKYNYYLPYMEDMFRLDKHPSIGARSGALSKSEARELVAYGKAWGIEIIPIVQTLGHLEKVLALPEYQDMSEVTEDPKTGIRRVLDVSNEKSYDLLRDLFAELFDVFDSEYVHIGCDETKQLGAEKNKDRVDRDGHAAVYLRHLERVVELLRPYHKKIMFYADMFNPTFLNRWAFTAEQFRRVRDLGVIFVNWDYEKRLPEDYYHYIKVLNDQKVRQVVGPGVWGWQAIYPSGEMVRRTTRVFLKTAFDEGIVEGFTSSWCDRGDNLRLNNMLNYALTAEYFWNIGTGPAADGLELVGDFCCRYYGVKEPALAQAHEFLGQLPWVFFDAGRHDPRYWLGVHRFPFAHSYVFWGPVRPDQGSKPDADRCRGVIARINGLLKRVQPLVRKVPRNTLNVAGLVLALRQFRFTCETVILGATFKPAHGGKVVRELEWIKDEFSRLWLATSKPERLDILQDRYDQLIAYYRRLSESPVGGPYPSTDNVPSADSFFNPTSFDLARGK